MLYPLRSLRSVPIFSWIALQSTKLSLSKKGSSGGGGYVGRFDPAVPNNEKCNRVYIRFCWVEMTQVRGVVCMYIGHFSAVAIP